jgi:GntR family transcriptional regulator
VITIDPRAQKAIYLQIVDNIKESIIKKTIKAGDKLPSVRELSLLLTTNPNTVSKAYQELERQKVIETIRGKGTFVSAAYTPRLDEDKIKELREALKDIVVNSHYFGFKEDDIREMLHQIYIDLTPGEQDD